MLVSVFAFIMHAMLVSVFAFIMLQFSWTPIPALAISCIALLVGAVGLGILYTILLHFTLDQMIYIGASADELSAAVQWYYWQFVLGLLVIHLLQCVPIWSVMFQHYLPTIFLTLSILCLSAVLISDCL